MMITGFHLKSLAIYFWHGRKKKKNYHAWPRPWSPEALVSVPELDDVVNMHQEHEAIPQLEEHC